jgi:hypothetical protein
MDRIEHVVVQGECLASISVQYGFFWGTLWDHPDNAELKKLRADPNILRPGDVVVIPPKTPKVAVCRTGQSHRFRLKGVPPKLRLRLLKNDEPRTGEPYSIAVGDRTVQGVVGDDGLVEAFLPVRASEVRLRVGEPGSETEYLLRLGHVDPLDTLAGAQARLRNLGLYQGEIDGTLGDSTRAALALFQLLNGLEETGELDEATRARLAESYRS